MQEPHFVIITIFLALSFSGCTSTNSSSTKLKYYNWSGLDAQLPNGTNATPSHNLPRSEYPFNNKGKYISSWAAEGNKRFGTKTTNRASSRKRSSRKPSTSSSSKYRFNKIPLQQNTDSTKCRFNKIPLEQSTASWKYRIVHYR